MARSTHSSGRRRALRRRLPIATAILGAAAVALLAFGSAAGGGAPLAPEQVRPGGVKSVRLTQLAHHDLASPGLDGQTKPRGQNTDVATLKGFAYVGGGPVFHGAHSSPGRVCTDWGGVKVVDLRNPRAPRLVTTITAEDTKGASARGGQRFNNVSVVVSSVDALSVRTPTFTGDVLALAIQRCEASLFTGARIEFWDVTNPAGPAKLGVFDPETITNPNPPPANGAWGIFEDVRLLARNDRLLALATTPFSIGNAHNASPFGDFRLIDATDLRSPRQVGTFPEISLGQDTPLGCRTFQAGRAVAPTPDGRSAILSWYDGSTAFDPARTSAVFRLDLDNLPRGTSAAPIQFNPMPAFWGYPTADPTLEGNAAHVEPFVGSDGRLYVIVSEDDIDPATTRINVTAPAAAAGSFRGCNILVGRHVYEFANQQIAGDIVYVGRACPAGTTTANQTPDELLADPRGRIALVAGGGNIQEGCSAFEKARRLAEAGALAMIQSAGSEQLNTLIAGPRGGIPPIPMITIPGSAAEKLQLVPSPILASATFPTSWTRSTPSNVTSVASAERADRFRLRLIANATDPKASAEVAQAFRFPSATGQTLQAGQTYEAGAFLQVESLTAGAYRLVVVWYGGTGTSVGETEIARLTAATPRTRVSQTVTPPAGATRAALRVEWTGDNAAGTAYADTFSFVPTGMQATIRDERGEWGAQRILDFSASPPAQVAVYRSPRSAQWPPPDAGLYAPRMARVDQNRLAFTTWLSDGLRVVDVSDPRSPHELASFVPPAVADPTPAAGAGGGVQRGPSWPTVPLVNGVALLRSIATGGVAVVTDINAGLYVVEYRITRQAATRTVGLGLSRHVVASGRVTAQGVRACLSGVPVTIQRNGRTVARATTRANGRYSVRLPDRTGRYRAVVQQVTRGGVPCTRAASRARTHGHRGGARR